MLSTIKYIITNKTRIRTKVYEQIKQSDVSAIQNTSQVAFAKTPISMSNSNDDFSSPTIQPSAVIKAPSTIIVLSNEISDRLLSKILPELSHVCEYSRNSLRDPYL